MLREEDYRLQYKFIRLKQRIKLREIAEYMKCSVSLISKYENEIINLSSDKVSKYIFFINNYQQMKEVN